jgi:hypothetical protein
MEHLMNIQIFVLKNGKAIIGEHLSNPADFDHYCVRRPVEIRGNGSNIDLIPYLDFAEEYEDGLRLNKVGHVNHFLSPKMELKQRYISLFPDTTSA